MLSFDPTIDLGTLLAIVAFLSGAYKLNNNIVRERQDL